MSSLVVGVLDRSQYPKLHRVTANKIRRFLALKSRKGQEAERKRRLLPLTTTDTSKVGANAKA